MSKTPRNTSKNSGQNSSNFQGTLDTMKNMREKTTGSDGYLTKQLEAHTESMVKILRRHFNKDQAGNNNSTLTRSSTSAKPKSQMYTSVYKGTYQGIIDGLAKSKENDRLLKIENERIKASKDMLRSSARNIVAFPEKFRKGLINIFAFERSEILSTYRSIRHSVGLDGKGGTDYQERLFRLMLEDRSKKGGGFVNSNTIGLTQIQQQKDMLDALESIEDATKLTVSRKFKTAEVLLGKKDAPMVKTMKNIEGNTSDANRRDIFVQDLMIKWTPFFAALTPVAIASNMGMGLAQAFDPMFMGVGILAAVMGGMWKKSQRSQDVQQTEILKNQLKQTEANDPIKIFGIGAEKTDTTNSLLKDIRTSVSPEEQKKTSLWDKFTKVPISELFKKQEKDTRTVADKNLDILEKTYDELIYNTDWTEKTFNLLYNGINVTPIWGTNLTVFEADNLQKLEGIEDANIAEIDAISSLKTTLCECLTSGSADDYKMSLKNNIGLEERERESMSNVISIRDSAAGIYDIMMQANGPDIAVKRSMVDTAKNALSVASDASEVLQGTKDLKDMVFGGKKGNVISLSDYTMKQFEDIFDDDGPLDLLDRKKRGRGRGGSRTPKSLPGGRGGKKGIFRKLLGGSKDLLNKIPVKSLVGKSKDLLNKIPVKEILKKSKNLITGIGLKTALTGVMAGVGGAVITDMLMPSEAGAGEDAYLAQEKVKVAKFLAKEKTDQEMKLAKDEMKRNYKAPIVVAPIPIKANAHAIVKSQSSTMNEIGKIFGNMKSKFGGVNADGVLAKGSQGMAMATGVATQIMEKAQGLEVGRSLTAIYQKSEDSRMELMSDMKDMLEFTKGSQTVQAIGESVNDVKNVVTGGTTNISVPVMAHDTDRNTNVMNNAYGA